MYAKISPEIALRRWVRAPHCYYRVGATFAKELTPEEYALLERCDGHHQLDEHDALLAALLERGLCVACEKGDEPRVWSRARLIPNRYFPSIGWGITSRCNYNCLHCFSAKDENRPTHEFSWEECLAFINEMDECGINAVTLTGGEPLMHPRFLDIVAEITKRGMFVREVNSNGALITPELLDELIALGVRPEFKISFDGLGHHDWLRNAEGAEKAALRAIKLCHEKGFAVRIQFCVHRKNLDSLLPTVEYFDAMGIEGIRIIRTSEAPRWMEKGGDATLGYREYYDAMVAFVKNFTAKPHYINVDVWGVIRLSPRVRIYSLVPLLVDAEKADCELYGCPDCRTSFMVGGRGEVAPCDALPGFLAMKGISFGNVHRTPLWELLFDSPFMNQADMRVTEIREHDQKCATCEHWKRCRGGCRALAAAEGSIKGHSPAMCMFFENDYERAFKEAFPEDWSQAR